MLESLGNIKNPLARSWVAATTTASVLVLTASIVLGLTGAKERSAFKFALYFSLLGTGGAAIAGFFYPTTPDRQRSRTPDSSFTDAKVWKDWRRFVVICKVKESEEITSFYLQPEDRKFLPSFQPGQFLPIKLDIPEQPKPILRTYSLSDYPASCDYYRLSIKRESAPAHLNVPPGVASNFMHDRINENSVILAKPPTGNFILDVQKSLPAVLISNGVGITPMVSMAKAVTSLNRDRPLWFFHGARDGRFHAFRDEISQIAAQNPNLQIHFAYSRPRPEDRGQYHSEGYIDVDLLRSLITEDAEYFLCGSPPFMDSIRQGLRKHGIPDHRVYFEMFSKAPPTQSSQSVAVPSVPGGAEVVFRQSGKTESWQDTADNLLEFAEAQGLNPPYSCRQGICGTCECRLLEGEVGYSAPPTAAIAAGSVLICIARPKTNRVVLDL